MDQHRDKFQRLLRELFQFDCADLEKATCGPKNQPVSKARTFSEVQYAHA
ncbi:MAG: hypothetical protein ACLFTT_15575 [Candidatus Hydrogenedentota bacterium]